MQPLVDADVIRYELGFAAEVGWQGDGVPHFDYVEELINRLVDRLCVEVGATAPPLFFFTGKTNFRNDIAKRQKYKDRAGIKPFHYYNITAYIKGKWEWREQEGLEADDLMAIMQTQRDSEISAGVVDSDGKPRIPTIICSRDKDLRGVNGWFYSWELANQPSFGPDLCDDYGWIKLTEKRHPKDPIKVKGRGPKFFLAQCITGDTVDTIPGLPKQGPVKAFKILEATTSYGEGLRAVLEAYREVYGDDAEKELLEQARLLWLVKEVDQHGHPIMWDFPKPTTDVVTKQ